jgi:oxygen-independent coproporphyrinogen-3 oxidase
MHPSLPALAPTESLDEFVMPQKQNAIDMFSARVPRYTSYPTAPHFHPGVTEQEYRAWLADLPADMPLSLYVHVPFCDTLCWFCGCHTKVVNHYRPVRDYCDLLLKEIALVAGALPHRYPVQHIHWGGGSPTLLEHGDMLRLNAALRGHFDVRTDAEFAIEVDPRGFTADAARTLGTAGVTRASIGLQDCDPLVQKAINRVQSDEETILAIKQLRGCGVVSINVDILYGLPHQTLASWQKTLEFALGLDPDRLAVFGYAHMPAFKKHQALIPEALLPGIELRFGMAELAREFFCEHGYVAVGLDHFAKPRDRLGRAARDGTLSRNFQGYTADTAPALIGFGASSIGSLPQGYVQNQTLVPDYRAALKAGRLPIARGVALTDDDRARREAIERLMCDMAVDLNRIVAKYGETTILADTPAALSDLIDAGVVSLNDGKAAIAPEWRAAARLVCAAFDRYLRTGAARHSVSV